MNPGEIVYNVKCEECGDTIRAAVVRESGQVICDHCMFPVTHIAEESEEVRHNETMGQRIVKTYVHNILLTSDLGRGRFKT